MSANVAVRQAEGVRSPVALARLVRAGELVLKAEKAGAALPRSRSSRAAASRR